MIVGQGMIAGPGGYQLRSPWYHGLDELAYPVDCRGVLFVGAGWLVENALRDLTSSMASASQQDLISGASQSMQSLAMIVGPLPGGWLYSSAGHAVPYLGATVIIALAIVSVLLSVAARPASTAPARAEAAEVEAGA